MAWKFGDGLKLLSIKKRNWGGVEKVITGQEFKIFDGPKHVSQIYENLGA